MDFWELEHCGNNECIIQEKSQIRQVQVGDILFIKGKSFPSDTRALVHKSPAVEYHGNGVPMHRLVLKVDVP